MTKIVLCCPAQTQLCFNTPAATEKGPVQLWSTVTVPHNLALSLPDLTRLSLHVNKADRTIKVMVKVRGPEIRVSPNHGAVVSMTAAALTPMTVTIMTMPRTENPWRHQFRICTTLLRMTSRRWKMHQLWKRRVMTTVSMAVPHGHRGDCSVGWWRQWVWRCCVTSQVWFRWCLYSRSTCFDVLLRTISTSRTSQIKG